jgi:hypothetical protein
MPDPIPSDPKPGFNYDPYKDEGGEVEDGITLLLLKWTGKGGLFSTWRERHIAISGVWAGLRAAQFADIPECPPLWMDEVQYYRGAALISNVAKIYGTSAVATATGIYLTLHTAGIV